MKKLEEYVRSIPDFPEPGIIFRDVTSILQDADGLHMAVDSLIDMVKDLDYDLVIGPESRGFIFGVPVAYAQHKGFVPVRKKGKLPCETISMEYDLEYGQVAVDFSTLGHPRADKHDLCIRVAFLGDAGGIIHRGSRRRNIRLHSRYVLVH